MLLLELTAVRVRNDEYVPLLLGFEETVYADVLVDVLLEIADRVGTIG